MTEATSDNYFKIDPEPHLIGKNGAHQPFSRGPDVVESH